MIFEEICDQLFNVLKGLSKNLEEIANISVPRANAMEAKTQTPRDIALSPLSTHLNISSLDNKKEKILTNLKLIKAAKFELELAFKENLKGTRIKKD